MQFKDIVQIELDNQGIKLADLAKRMNIPRQNLYSMLKYDNPTLDTITRIAKGLNINVNNFIYSVSDRDNDERTDEKTEFSPILKKSNSIPEMKKGDLIPIYDIEVVGGDVVSFDDTNHLQPTVYYSIPKYRGCIGTRYAGDSMAGTFRAGEILFLKPILDFRIIEFGNVHAVDLNDGRRLVKYLRKNPTDSKSFILKSSNPEYDDMEIPLETVSKIYLVVGHMEDAAMYHSNELAVKI